MGLCADCRAELAGSPLIEEQPGGPLAYAGTYTGVLRTAVVVAKERKALGLVGVLGGLLAGALAALALRQDTGVLTLVPVPTVWAHIHRRGIDLPVALARVAARRLRPTGMVVRVMPGLRLVRATADQARLGAAQRARNVVGAFAWPGPAPVAPVVVVDDVVTTGATMAQAMTACRQAGAQVLGGACVARTRLR